MASMLLADQGAIVTKVEVNGLEDAARSMGPAPVVGMAAMHMQALTVTRTFIF